MTSLFNNSYTFGIGSGFLVQRLLGQPLYLTVPCSMIVHRILGQTIPNAFHELGKLAHKHADLIDRSVAKLAVPFTCIGLTYEHFTSAEAHFIDLAAKGASLLALRPIMIEPALNYFSPVKRLFDTLEHPAVKYVSKTLTQSVQTIMNTPMIQVAEFVTKVSLARILAETLAENVSSLPFSSTNAFRAFALVTVGGTFAADLLTTFKFETQGNIKAEDKKSEAFPKEKAQVLVGLKRDRPLPGLSPTRAQ